MGILVPSLREDFVENLATFLCKRSGSAHGDLELADEGSAHWDLGSRLRSGSAHWDLELADEVRQCPLRSGAGEEAEAEAAEAEAEAEAEAGDGL
eukprot:s1737_g8.t1